MTVTSESGMLETSKVTLLATFNRLIHLFQLGWISLACWIIVYSPQLFENYRRKSGEGLSVALVLIWLTGDILNLLGSLLARLLPTVSVLAAYYTLCDTTLLCQIYYYRLIRSAPSPNPPNPDSTTDEHSPLLRHQPPSNPASNKNIGHDTLGRRAIRYTLSFSFVIGTGIAAWAIDRLTGSRDRPAPATGEEVIEWKSQLLGYASAFCYFGSRIPQILKNRKTRCEGLSLALFMYTLTGNITYTLSICVASTSKRHLLANASWILGSVSTILFDLIVVFQFYHYQWARDDTEALST